MLNVTSSCKPYSTHSHIFTFHQPGQVEPTNGKTYREREIVRHHLQRTQTDPGGDTEHQCGQDMDNKTPDPHTGSKVIPWIHISLRRFRQFETILPVDPFCVADTIVAHTHIHQVRCWVVAGDSLQGQVPGADFGLDRDYCRKG